MTKTYRMTIGPVEEARAFRLWGTLAEALNACTAVALNATECGQWRIEIIFAGVPDIENVRKIIEGLVDGGSCLPEPSVELLPDEDWVARSQAGLVPVRAGRFLIHGSHDRAAARGIRLAIEIDAGQAFGTAHHGTTRGCLIALDLLARTRPLVNVLDIGTGTGVLAIAAAKAANARVLATDIDPVAIRVAKENCKLNGVAGLVTCIQAEGTLHPQIQARRPYELVLANILAPPLKALTNPIRGCLGPGGLAILSGMLSEQARAVCAHYRANGFVLKRRIDLEGWSTLLLGCR